MKQLRIFLYFFVVLALMPLGSPVAHADVDIYTTPGYHSVNGREWRTTCEPYSQTKRCRTEIKATQISQQGGRFVQSTGWVFNNLTYAASPRMLWNSNVLGGNGAVGAKVAWSAPDGRKWRTECDTAVTGRGGCRSYIEASIIETYTTSKDATAYRWKTSWLFNNMVRFSAAPTKPAPGVASLATTVLAQLPVKGRAPKTGYARDEFGQTWADTDRNGCDTRNDILRRELTQLTTESGTRDCVILSGTLHDPYTATTINFVRGQTTSTEVQIDHVVALSDSWQKGAQQLDPATRLLFANDPLNLLAVQGRANMQKGDGDAATWLPANKSFRCQYVARQVGVKHRYRLWVTQAEHDAIAGILASCPKQTIPNAGTRPVVTAPTTPAPTTPAPQDVYYANCDAVRAAGKAPLYEGDPGYRKGLDGDGDGIACEP